MSKAMEDMREEAVFKATVQHIRQMMKRFDLTINEALETFEIPEAERPRYIAAI